MNALNKNPQKKALVAGANWKFVKENLAKSVSKFGIVCEEYLHWDGEQNNWNKKIPEGVDLILIMIQRLKGGASTVKIIKANAAKVGVPVISLMDSKALYMNTLESLGLEYVGPHVVDAIRQDEPVVPKEEPMTRNTVVNEIKPAVPTKTPFEEDQDALWTILDRMRDHHNIRSILYNAGETPEKDSLQMDREVKTIQTIATPRK